MFYTNIRIIDINVRGTYSVIDCDLIVSFVLTIFKCESIVQSEKEKSNCIIIEKNINILVIRIFVIKIIEAKRFVLSKENTGSYKNN